MEHDKHFTLIAIFDDAGYEILNSNRNKFNEKVSRVPYCRVPDSERYMVDNLPYHLTVSSSKLSQNKILEELEHLSFKEFNIKVIGVGIMSGINSSQVLYYKVDYLRDFDNLQNTVYGFLHNCNYLPGRNTPHITIAISKDHHKIERIKSLIEHDFKSFELRIKSLALYRIWPGELIKEYKL